MFISKKKLKIIKRAIEKVSKESSDERGSKCGYDLVGGILAGDFDGRLKAWERHLGCVARGDTIFTDEERDGIWVPAINY